MVRRYLAMLLGMMSLAAAPVPPAPDTIVSGSFQLPDRQPWAGEVFTLGLVWRVDWDQFRYLDGDLAWKPDPLVTEGWTRLPLTPPQAQGGRTVADLAFTTRAIALAPGRIQLPPPVQQMQIVTGSYETSGVTIATIGPVMATGAGARLAVRALPPAPAGFGGAVGDFALTSALDVQGGEVGKPIVWTVTLSGTGNWMGFDGIPSRPLPRAFDLLGAPKRGNGQADSLFERTLTEAITIVPRTPGRFALGPVDLVVFDPRAGAYRTLVAPAVEISIAPAAAGSEVAGYDPEPVPPPADARLPPALAGVGDATPPLSRWAWNAVLAAPLVLLALLFLGLATHRALVTDPHRQARRAHARLASTLAALARAADTASQRALLRRWQRDAGIRLGIGHAAPTAAMIARPDWSALWAEAERSLYGPDVPLGADWPGRAAAALAAVGEPPPFRPARILDAARLAPAALLLAMAVTTLVASDAALAARPAAPAPRDWIAHYTMARNAALAKQWPRAAAHAGIAWVQNPRAPETRALWRLAALEAGVGGSNAGGLPLPDTMMARLIGQLPPIGWQLTALAGALLLTGGCGALLLQRFGHGAVGWRRPAAFGAGLGALGMAAGVAGSWGYGAAAAPDAAITWRPAALRPLPVATPDSEARQALAPGTVGHMDGRFIGWVRFTLPDGRSGWLRRGEVMSVWQHQPG